MTTNEIEKQLRQKAERQIKEHSESIVDGLQKFIKLHGGVNKNGMTWYSKRVRLQPRFDGDEREDPFNFHDWAELRQLIERNMKENFVDQMVQLKAKELLSKIDLFE
jgi:hypothetical protein